MKKVPKQKPGRSRQDYVTPVEFIEAVTRRWGPIDVDLAASDGQERAPVWVTPEMDTFSVDWTLFAGLLWINPEFKDAARTLAKALASMGCGRVILVLLPASVSTDYFAKYVWPAAGPLARVITVRPRIAFEGEEQGYPKDLMLVGYGLEPGFETWNWKEQLEMAGITKTFAAEDLLDIGLPFDCEGGEVLERTIVDQSRWAVEYELVFRLPKQKRGAAWRTTYRVGATEMQDERPWENEDEVTCTLVHQQWVHKREWVQFDPEKPPPSSDALAIGNYATRKLMEARLALFKARERLKAGMQDDSHPMDVMKEVLHVIELAYEDKEGRGE